MAQSRLRDYKDPLLSYEHNLLLNLGIHNPGRYSGFDTLGIAGAGLTFSLIHVGSGYNPKTSIDTPFGKFGVYVTPQGVVIAENESIGPFTIDTNAGNSYIRYDAIVATHNYVAISGGQTATYSIIKGTIGSALKPEVSNPDHQIILGYLKIPAGATDISVCLWQPSKAPDSGDWIDAALMETNKFAKTQNQNQADDSNITYNSDNTLTLKSAGNLYTLTPGADHEINGINFSDFDPQDGLNLTFLVNEHITLKTISGLTGTQINNGFKPVVIAAQCATKTNTIGTPPDVINTWEYTAPAGTFAVVEITLLDGDYIIKSVSNLKKTLDNAVRNGTLTFWWGDIPSNFDSSGVGFSYMAGYYVANGSTYTLPDSSVVTVPDMRGRFPMGSSAVPSDLTTDSTVSGPRPYGSTGGLPTVPLSVANLPAHNHTVSDPGHRHKYKQVSNFGEMGSMTDYPRYDPFLDGRGSQVVTDGDTFLYGTSTSTTGITIQNAGSNVAHENIPPYFAAMWIIKLY